MIDSSNRNSVWSLDELTNVGHVVTEAAQRMGDCLAVAAPAKTNSRRPINYDSISFSELERHSNRIAIGLRQLGIRPGTRLALLVPPGLAFVSFVFGLFKAGVVVIMIDPGMGRKNMIRCLSAAQPEGIVGIGLAQLMRVLFARKFPVCKKNIVVGRRWWPGCVSANKFDSIDADTFAAIEQSREAEAAIIFTTGSTGPPKGVLYRHRIFLEQARQIRDYFSIQPGSVDVSGFPLFALFNCAMGTTTVFPQMDASRPADVDPLDIKDAIDKFAADQSFGSPALWNTVSQYAVDHDLIFPTMRKVFSAGAPVPPHVLKRIKKIIHPDGEVYTPYGATESLPIACNRGHVVLTETAAKTEQGFGTCVGHRFPEIEWKIIEIDDDPIAKIEDTTERTPGDIGELIVKGDVVTDQYVTETGANAYHKVKDGTEFWHRMGDVGYFDNQQRFWFCGRKSHRVITSNGALFTIVIEGIVNTHPRVYRSALVGVGIPGNQTPVIVVEPWADWWPVRDNDQEQLIQEVLEICGSNERSLEIKTVLLKRKLPVDIRHNSKIFREQVAKWARQRI